MREQIARQTYSQAEDTDSEYEDVWPTRQPNNAIRLNTPLPTPRSGVPQAPAKQPIRRQGLTPGQTYIPPGTYIQGNTRLNVHYGAPPSKQKGWTVRNTEEPQTLARSKKRWKIHPVLYLGIGMLVMFALWVALTSLVSWVELKIDDLSYGYPRTYQFDAVVGHNDSAGSPTHFIILNLSRKVEAIELPGGDASKAHIYIGPTLIDPGSDLFPVTAYVRDVNNDGKPDLILKIKSSIFVLINTGTEFRPLQPGEHISI